MLIYTPRPDDTVMVQPEISLKAKDMEFPEPNFILKNGFYYDNSILEQIEQPDGTINFEFRSVCIKQDNGENHYNILGHHHRLDGPAVIRRYGSKIWLKNDKLHRTNGPAVIWPNGTEEWYLDDKRHNPNGPAITRPDGPEEYYINGNKVNKKSLNKTNL